MNSDAQMFCHVNLCCHLHTSILGQIKLAFLKTEKKTQSTLTDVSQTLQICVYFGVSEKLHPSFLSIYLWNSILVTGRNEVMAKVMFLLVSVILLTWGVCLSACWEQTPPWKQTPPQKQTPREQTPPRSRHPLGADTPPRSRHPSGSRHTHPSLEADTPPPGAGSGIRSMSGRYASYWNAFLLMK